MFIEFIDMYSWVNVSVLCICQSMVI